MNEELRGLLIAPNFTIRQCEDATVVSHGRRWGSQVCKSVGHVTGSSPSARDMNLERTVTATVTPRLACCYPCYNLAYAAMHCCVPDLVFKGLLEVLVIFRITLFWNVSLLSNQQALSHHSISSLSSSIPMLGFGTASKVASTK